jgi:gas vesicle protein
MNDDSGGAEFLAGLIIGGLLGAAAALLLAPQPGEEMRAELRERGIELKERVSELSQEARRRAEHMQVEGLSTIESQKTRLEGAIEEGKKAAAQRKQELLDELEQETGQAQA